jgi:HEAT repeat protein
MKPTALGLLCLVTWAAVGLLPIGASAQGDASPVSPLIRDLADPDFEKSQAAAEALARYPQHRQQIVPALIEAIQTRDWPRCAGDMRDAMARTLAALKAKEAVAPLLALVKSGRPIDHECLE